MIFNRATPEPFLLEKENASGVFHMKIWEKKQKIYLSFPIFLLQNTSIP
jgi:hypothetical protein